MVFADLCAGRFPNTHENGWRTRDGGRRLIAWANAARVDAVGAVAYVIASGIDVTERRAAEADARTRAAQLALLTAQLLRRRQYGLGLRDRLPQLCAPHDVIATS